MTYRTAVKLLTGKDPAIEKALDVALSGALLATSPVLGPAALAFIDAKNDIVKHGAALVDGLSSRLRGMPVPERAQNVRAAWTVLAISAFCDATIDMLTRSGWPKAAALRADVAAKQLDSPAGALIRALIDSQVPFPRPDEAYTDVEARLEAHYQRSAARMGSFLEGLAPWDELSESDRMRLDQLPQGAVACFSRSFRRLAAEVPELMVWLMLHESRASRAQLAAAIGTGLAGLRQMLDSILSAQGAARSRWHASLASHYAADLAKPLIDIDRDVERVAVAPSIAEGYLNPRFQVTRGRSGSNVAVESWWSERPIREDLQRLLTAYLLTETATASPLLILGHPGAGKSMLTRVLAAQLPQGAFCAVRVPLRSVAASSSVLEQIVSALHQTISEPVLWPEFVEGLEGAMPVVILDGFDELIQATGVSRSDYLEQVQEFQEREAGQGRPVAVIVTSRTSVADRVRIPAECMIVKLEPFSDDQVRTWIGKWNEANECSLAERGIARLDPDTVLAYRELAIQPILLLMLALYDAAGNGLKRDGDTIKPTALYERLLTTFVEREVRKEGAFDPEILRQRVQDELYRLSIVAYAMFNRGTQILYERDLVTDFRSLQIAEPRNGSTVDGFQVPISSAQRTLSRFFFVHPYEAQDVAGDAGSLGRSFEFLHATFSEFLIVRCAIEIVRSLAARGLAASPWSPTESPTQDPLLRALLSFQAFTKRGQVVDFLVEAMRELTEAHRDQIARTVSFLLRGCMAAESDSRYADYQPVATDQPRRYAHFSLNLCLIYLAARGGRVDIDELMPKGEWAGWAGLWRARLDPDAGRETAAVIDVKVDSGHTMVGLGRADETDDPLSLAYRTAFLNDADLDNLLRWSRLQLDARAGAPVAMLHALQPLLGSLATSMVIKRTQGRLAPVRVGAVSAVLPLLQLSLDSLDDEGSVHRAFGILLEARGQGVELATHIVRLAVRYSRFLGIERLERIWQRYGEHCSSDAYVDLATELYARTKEWSWLTSALSSLKHGSPGESVGMLVDMYYRGVLPFDLFLEQIRDADLVVASRESPGNAAKAVNLLQILGKQRPLWTSNLEKWLRGIVNEISPEARALVNYEAVAALPDDTCS